MKLNLSLADIYYEIIGEGIPVLLLHGYSLDHHVMKGAYEPIFAQLQGFKRIYLDLPAMGESLAKEGLGSSQDILDSIFEFINNIIGHEPFIVIGQSYGGYLAQAIISRIPDQTLGMGLVCPVVITDSDQRKLPDHEMMIDHHKLIQYDNKEIFNDFLSFAVVATQSTYDRFKQDVLPGLLKASNDLLLEIREQAYTLTPEPYETINNYDKPSLLLVGKQDATVGYKDVLLIDKQLKNATLAMVNSAGHSLQYEQEEIFNQLTLNWLKSFL